VIDHLLVLSRIARGENRRAESAASGETVGSSWSDVRKRIEKKLGK